jgi:hypothetical protein
MNFKDLYQKIRELDTSADEACGDPMPAPAMEKPETPEPTMNVNMNAQGMDNIEGMMKLFQKVNPDMMPKDEPSEPKMAMPPMIKLPIEKDGMDNEEPEMDDKEKEEAWDNEPDPEYDDIDAVTSGGDDLHKRKGSYPATAGGDNPRALESQDLRGKIKEELWKALSEAKKQDVQTTEGRGRGKKKKMEDQTTTEGRGRGRGKKKMEDQTTTEGRGKGKGRGRGKG